MSVQGLELIWGKGQDGLDASQLWGEKDGVMEEVKNYCRYMLLLW